MLHNRVPTKFVDVRLNQIASRYPYASNEEFGLVTDTTGTSFSKWRTCANGISYSRAVIIAHVFGLKDVHALANTGRYDLPDRLPEVDLALVSRRVLRVLRGTKRKVDPELRRDIKDRLTAYLEEAESTAPDNPVLSPEVGRSLLDAMEGTEDDPAENDAYFIRNALCSAEATRRKYGLEWFVKADGSLGAKRVTVEEF